MPILDGRHATVFSVFVILFLYLADDIPEPVPIASLVGVPTDTHRKTIPRPFDQAMGRVMTDVFSGGSRWLLAMAVQKLTGPRDCLWSHG